MSSHQSIEFRSSFTRARTVFTLPADQECVAGSGANSTVVLQGKDILENHAKLIFLGNQLHVVPVGESPVSVNGHPISELTPLDDGDWLSLGSSLFQVNLPDHPPPSQSAQTQHNHKTGVLTIGRLSECDLEIASPLVSRAHARLICDENGVMIEDLHSTNGTFVNGQLLVGRVHLRPGDRVAIATFEFTFTGEALEPVDIEGRVRVEVRDLCKEVPDRATGKAKRILDQINLVIEPSEFVAIFGTSGSGKSTLLDALNGRRPATHGRVLYNGTDLYAAFDLFRSAIGCVPQQDIVHRKISVECALKYTARLRLPPDTTSEEIKSHIARVLDKVGLTEKATLPIDTPTPLSGGQLKRVSLAVELVANPNILFLDEVTSGLDAGTDKRMMRLFADLAADQKTVICVTHSLENIDVCHLVTLLHRGKLAYFGPPREAPGYFGIQRLSDVYDLLESSPGDYWAERFTDSSFYKVYIADRLTESSYAIGENLRIRRPSSRIRRLQFNWFQAGILMRRYLDLILADRRNLGILLLQAPLIATVVGLVFDTEGPLPVRAAAESQVTFILVLSAIWFGCLNSARELVKELPIYLRERAVNLRIGPYLTSKILPQASLCALQCLMLLTIVSALVSLPGNFMERLLALFVASMASTGMGLAVSAFVDSNDKAIATVPILLIPQVVLSNAVVRLGDVGLIAAKTTMISFWAFDALKTTLSSETLGVRDGATGQLVVPVSGSYGQDLAMIAVLGGVFLAAAVIGLKLKDRRE